MNTIKQLADQTIFNSMNDDQKYVAYFLIGQSIGLGNLSPMLSLSFKKHNKPKPGTVYEVYETMTKQQKELVSRIAMEALSED